MQLDQHLSRCTVLMTIQRHHIGVMPPLQLQRTEIHKVPRLNICRWVSWQFPRSGWSFLLSYHKWTAPEPSGRLRPPFSGCCVESLWLFRPHQSFSDSFYCSLNKSTQCSFKPNPTVMWSIMSQRFKLALIPCIEASACLSTHLFKFFLLFITWLYLQYREGSDFGYSLIIF